MKHLKRLALSLTLMSALSVAAFAEPASPPCAPGETSTPPCPAQSVNDEPLVPGQTSTPPALPVVSVTDMAETMLWALLLF